MKQHLVLTVDHNKRNLELLARYLEQAGYRTLGVSSIEQLDQTLGAGNSISLALVDISGFDRSIWERCRQLSELGIPLLIVSPRQSAAIHQESMSHGAQSVLVKPLVIRELLALLARLIED